MFITGIEGPGGRITWCTGAAPSGCGKTTTAMAGDHFVGDDLAQMWIAEDGGIRSVNPECGIFGIVEDVNWEGDPKLMENLRQPGHRGDLVQRPDRRGRRAPLERERGRAARRGDQFPGPLETGDGRCQRQAGADIPPQRPLHPGFPRPGQLQRIRPRIRPGSKPA